MQIHHEQIINTLEARLNPLLKQLRSLDDNVIKNILASQYKVTTNFTDELMALCSLFFSDVNKLAKLESDPRKFHYLMNAKYSLEEMMRHCNKLLRFSDAQLNSHPQIRKKIVIRQLVDKVITQMLPLAGDKQIRLAHILGNNLPYIMLGDNYRISRILKHLIANAILYTTNSGNIIVTINVFDKARQEIKYDKPKELVLQFIVRSTSHILSKEHQQLIYKPYTDSVSILEDINLGMDLDIAIVKQFVHEIQGELDVRSTEKEYTIFMCFLPLTLPLIDNIINEIV